MDDFVMPPDLERQIRKIVREEMRNIMSDKYWRNHAQAKPRPKENKLRQGKEVMNKGADY